MRSYCFVQKTDHDINKKKNSWFQKMKMKFHISAKNLFLDQECTEDYIAPPLSRDNNVHIRVNGLECIIPRICDHSFGTHSSDRRVKPRKRNGFIRRIKMRIFKPSAKELFQDIGGAF